MTTASIKTSVAQSVSAKPRSQIALSSDYAYFKMHEVYAAGADKISDDSPDSIFSDFTPNNAPDWSTNPTWLTGSTLSGGNAAGRAATAGEKAFMRTDDLSGSILVSAWVGIPDAISGGDYLFSYGNSNDDDHWAVSITTARKLNCSYGTVDKTFDTAIDAGAKAHVGVIFDMANSLVRGYLNGVADGTNAITQLSAAPATDRVGFCCRMNAAAGALEFAESDTTTTYDPLLSDLMIIRFETDISSQFSTIMADLADTPRGWLPWSLDGK